MRNRIAALLALLAALALVVAACSSSDDESSDSEVETDDATSESADGGGEDGSDDAGEAGDGAQGGTVVIGTTQVARHLNGVVQSGYATALPGTQVNAGLVLYDDQYNASPYLAESWELSDDGLTLTITLVEGATFHDGEPITSEDVAFSMLAARDNHPFTTMFAPVESVDTPDERTAVVNLSQPHPAIQLALSPALLPIIPQHVYDDGQDLKEHPRNGTDVIGSGPFKVVEFNPSEVIRLEANEDFFLGRPNLDEIIIQVFPDNNSLLLSVEAGEVDMAAISSTADIERLRNVEGLTVTDEGHQGLGVVNWLEFNTEDEVLSDVRVRQAIAHAIDRDFITDVLHGGLFPAAPSPIAPSSPFFHDGIETYDLDIDTARALLDEAGYGDGDISLEIDYIPGPDPIQKNVAEYIVQALEEIGIDAQLRVSPDFPTWATRISTGDYDLTMNNVWNWGDPVIGVHRSYLSDNRVGVIWTNNSGYANDEVDTLLAEAGQTIDADERRATYIEFQDAVAADVPIYWLNDTTFWQAYPSDIVNPPISIWGHMSPMHELALGS